MDESAPMRAIMIGASVFVTIATITGVLAYYSSAKDLVNVIGTGTDIGAEYANYVENILLKTEDNVEIRGTDVINLLNYFYMDEKEYIYIEYYAEKIKYNLSKRIMRFSSSPPLVFMTYIILHQIEIMNLVNIVEGIRYGMNEEQIEKTCIF